MKVQCIQVDRTNNHSIPNLPHPELGETATVVDERIRNGKLFYQLDGYEQYNGKDVLYDSKKFIPLSDLDETTLVNEEFNEKYCVPVNQ